MHVVTGFFSANLVIADTHALGYNIKKIKYLIMGVDYFQFSFLSDTRNYIYGNKFSNEYMKDFENSKNFINKLNFYFEEKATKFKISLNTLLEVMKNRKIIKIKYRIK